jgi:hypothetical protein
VDVALLFYALEGDFILPVAEKYEHHWLYGRIGDAIGAIWLDRFNADVGSVREILARMKAGGILVIAPEDPFEQKPWPKEAGRSLPGDEQDCQSAVRWREPKTGWSWKG